MPVNNKNFIIVLAVIIIFIIGAGLFVRYEKGVKPVNAQLGKYDEFAKCLSQKGAKMYGAFWCNHCQKQEDMFGASFQFINYVDCAVSNTSQQIKDVCVKEKIQIFPTWEFSDGSRQAGELKLEKLSALSGCQLPPSPTAAK